MATIEGLTAELCQSLAGVEVGDLLLIDSYLKDEASYVDESESESDTDSAPDLDRGDDAVMSGDDEGGAGPTSDGSVEHVEVAVVEIVATDTEDDGGEGNDGEGNDGEVNDGQGNDGEVNDGEAAVANDTAGAETNGSAEHVEHAGGEEQGENDNAGDNDEDERESEDEHSESDSPQNEPAALYTVEQITKNDEGSITDISLCLLNYQPKLSEADGSAYHIYGAILVESFVSSEEDTTTEPLTIKDIRSDTETKAYTITCSPDGDLVRNLVFHRRCPAHCEQGWLPTQEKAQAMVPDTLATLLPHEPVCPACMGKDLMQEYHGLRQMLDVQYVDFTLVTDFYFRLNPRRTVLGYPFRQLDERDWGYAFDDMLSNDGDEDDESGDDNGNWGYYQEAMDPNSGVVLRPASETAIAALPRKIFAEIEKGDAEDQSKCLVCLGKFTDDDVVVLMPCGHVFCETGCIEQWLKQFNSCPTCRAKLPALEVEAGKATVDGGVAQPHDLGEGTGGNEGQREGSEGAEAMSSDSDEVEKDGEDVVMGEATAEVVA
ncbi:protein K48-linked ubiquitination [Vermiconidia calcicola]|uniref:Protein K48-linked ubiquitination n=1 Tax=Vermiconidia calcicola TaxID=1690605 RepID=A0ACC3NKR6_9PEZI|nr:protein K48-linked ubiquitination [Vermiconidia calcicola]